MRAGKIYLEWFASYQSHHCCFQAWFTDGVLSKVLNTLAEELLQCGKIALLIVVLPAQKRGLGVGSTMWGKGSAFMTMANRSGLPNAIGIDSATPHEATLVKCSMDLDFIIRGWRRLIGDRAYDVIRWINVYWKQVRWWLRLTSGTVETKDSRY